MSEPKQPNFMDFSKEELYAGWQSAVKGLQILAVLWIKAVEDRFGKEASLELNDVVWALPHKSVEVNKVVEVEDPPSRLTMANVEISQVKEWLKVPGNDVETLSKCLPCMLGTVGSLFYDIELKNKNHGIFTVKRCMVLEMMENMNEEIGGLDPRYLCYEVEAPGFAEAAHYINPKIKTIPRKLPPRNSKDEPACQYEYILEE